MRVRLEEYIKVFLFVLSVVVVGAAVIDYGFELDAREASVMEHIYEVAWWCYFLMFTLWILFNRKGVEGIKAYMSWILALMLYLPVISKLSGATLCFAGDFKGRCRLHRQKDQSHTASRLRLSGTDIPGNTASDASSFNT